MAKNVRALRSVRGPEAHEEEEEIRHTPDFSVCTFPELVEIKSALDAEIGRRKVVEIETLKEQVTKQALTLGVSVEDIFGLQAPTKRFTRHSRGPQPAKYRGPGGEEWSGRGPSPAWMKPLLEQGKTKEDFLIVAH